MNFNERAMLARVPQLEVRITDMESRLLALMELFEIYRNRGRGRPPVDEAMRIEALEAIIEGKQDGRAA